MADWGITAARTTWNKVDYSKDLGADDSWVGYGFVRDVDHGVKLLPLAGYGESQPWCRRSVDTRDQFVMAMPGESMPAVETLLDLQQSLETRRESLVDGDPLLKRFDAVIDRFLVQVESLHDQGIPLGILTPRSICVVGDGRGEDRIYLPDLGFVYDTASRAMSLPPWMTDPATNMFFEGGADTRNAAYLRWSLSPDDDSFQSLAAEDVRIAGRVIATALAGEKEVQRWSGDGCLSEVPPPNNGVNDTACQPVWDALSRAIRGQLGTIGELRESLAGAAQPSRHFLVKPPPRPLSTQEMFVRRMATLGVASALAALGAVSAFMAVKAFSPTYTSICPHVWSWDERLYPPLRKLEESARIANANAEAKETFRQELREYISKLRATPDHKCDESCTDALLAKMEPWIEEDVKALLAKLREHPRWNAEEIAILRTELARIDECIGLRHRGAKAFLQTPRSKLEHQLGLRGAPSAETPPP
jgi:hypothetical protein